MSSEAKIKTMRKKLAKAFDRLNFENERIRMRTLEAKRPDTLEELEKDVATLDTIIQIIRSEQEDLLAVDKSYGNWETKDASPEARAAKFSRFLAWVSKEAPNCFVEDRVTISHTVAEGAGVVALKDITKDDALLAVPRSLMLTLETAYKSPMWALVAKDRVTQAMPSLILSLHLLYERFNASSYWTPYLDTLPSTPSIPIAAPLPDLALLQGSPAYESALKLRKTTARQYAHVFGLAEKHSRFDSLPLFTYDQFVWAIATVMARQNKVPLSEKSVFSNPANAAKFSPELATSPTTPALIPVFDCLNHTNKPGQLSTYYNAITNASETAAFEDAKASEQVYTVYGGRPNSLLFLYSGFVVEDLAGDRVLVNLKFNVQDPLFAIKRMLLMKLGLGHVEIVAPLTSSSSSSSSAPGEAKSDAAPAEALSQQPPPPSPPPPPPVYTPLTDMRDVWRLLYVLDMTKDEANDALKNLGKPASPDSLTPALTGPCPESLYARVGKALEAQLQRAIDAYPTSLEDDEAAIASATAGLTAFQKLAKRLIVTEKRQLAAQLKAAQAMSK